LNTFPPSGQAQTPAEEKVLSSRDRSWSRRLDQIADNNRTQLDLCGIDERRAHDVEQPRDVTGRMTMFGAKPARAFELLCRGPERDWRLSVLDVNHPPKVSCRCPWPN